MSAEWLPGTVFTIMLFSLRVAPVFAFAPPFNLVRAPVTFRLLLGLGVAACIVGSDPSAVAAAPRLDAGALFTASVTELMLGAIFVLAFQLTFAALQVAGRTLDIQAGFGLALLIDPATRAQVPLVGTIFVYAAGAVFFAIDGHFELLRIFAASLDSIPVGGHSYPTSLDPLLAFLATVFLTAFGVAGGTMLALFLTDLAITMLSRTVPQMNVLVLGFQVKILVLLITLPITLGFAGAILLRMMRVTLEALPRLV
ncbi:flagellar biosynthetic protein FliR [Allosphingosinicella sp.]|jgi:flagellar biosynthetic protein FliR|uniref:flagellar biosynthetic protein FliR n=1 Tax=Allosphingosinicella sp. TaxID=2823234 RepID=UPI002EFF8E3A